MRTKCVWLVLVIFSSIGFATQVTAADRLGNYLAIKGGIYSPNATFHLSNVDVETTFDGDAETGVDGEFGIGAYFTEFDVDDNLNTFEGTATFGIHAGAGVNVGNTRNMFIGLEGRYVWPSGRSATKRSR